MSKKRLVLSIITALSLFSVFFIWASPGQPGAVKEMPVTHNNSLNGKTVHLEKLTQEKVGIYTLDHFKVYQIDPQNVSAQVYLRGQFDDTFQPAFLYQYDKFLNPVSKNDEGIINKFHHLNWYWIESPADPTRAVTLYNQFGLQTIKIGQAVALLAPAEKVEPGSQPPEKLDHYKVYEVISAQPVNRQVYLRDQFGEEQNFAYIARYFAVPVDKRHNNAYFPIINEKDHIIFYTLEPFPWEEYRPTRDQFGGHDMKTQYTELLGVPSDKLAWQ